jgi:hypothetical protein
VFTPLGLFLGVIIGYFFWWRGDRKAWLGWHLFVWVLFLGTLGAMLDANMYED